MTKTKGLVCYGLNFAPELVGIGKFTSEFVSEIKQRYDKVYVICATPYYPQWVCHEGYFKYFYSVEVSDNVIIIRCPHYIPKCPNSITRILHLLSFALTSFPILLYVTIKYRFNILNIVPTYFSSFVAILVSKLLNCKVILHIQDLEVDAFLAGKSYPNFLKKICFSFERILLSLSDAVSTISEPMLASISKKANLAESNTKIIPNWADVKWSSSKRNDEVKNIPFNLNEPFWLYAGTLGKKQLLDKLIHAFHLSKIRSVRLIIVGKGPKEKKLKEIVKSLALENVHFINTLPNDDFKLVLQKAKGHFVLQDKKIIDLVLPSKLSNIFAVGGNSLVSVNKNDHLHCLLKKYPSLFIPIFNNDLQSIINGMFKLIDQQTNNDVAIKYASECLDKVKCISNHIEFIEGYDK